MPKKKRPELTDEERAKRLKEMAREVEAEQSGQAFREAFRQVTKTKPKAVPTRKA